VFAGQARGADDTDRELGNGQNAEDICSDGLWCHSMNTLSRVQARFKVRKLIAVKAMASTSEPPTRSAKDALKGPD